MPLAKPTKPDAITAVPTPVPLRTDRANFAARGDAMMGWFPDGVDEINTTSDYMDDAANFAEQEANEAEASATAAAASNAAAAVNAAAAAASAGATVWVTGSTYTAGVVRYSPTNFSTYRDTAGGLSSTDPASDTTGRWQSAMLPSAEAIGLPAMPPTAVFNFASGVIDRRFVESRSTDGTRYNIFGNLETLSAGVAKPTYDPATNEAKGYLAEPAATYLAMRSTEMDNGSYWFATNATVTPAAAIGIDGALSMYKVEAVLSGGSVFSRAVTATATAQYYAVRAKKGTSATKANGFVIYNGTTATQLAVLTINYDTGVVTQSIGTGATAEPVGHDGIWEIRIPCTSGITIGNSISVYCAFIGLGTDAAADFAYVGFPDIADKPNLTHIPTDGSNVTTTVGRLLMDLTAHDEIINPRGFTCVMAFRGDSIVANPGVQKIPLSLGNLTTDYVYLDTNVGNLRVTVVVASVTIFQATIGTIVAGRNVVAFSISPGECLGVLNNDSVFSLGTLSEMPEMTWLGAGCFIATPLYNYELSDPIEHITPFPRACTAGELRAFVNNF